MFCKFITKYVIAVKLAIKEIFLKMAASIVCYNNLANKQGITMVLPVVINKIGGERTKLADYHNISKGYHNSLSIN